jgi:hypothetical protein
MFSVNEEENILEYKIAKYLAENRQCRKQERSFSHHFPFSLLYTVF